MAEHLFKLKNDEGKTAGYLLLKSGAIFWKTRYECDEWTCNPEFAFNWASAHPFVTKDKNGEDVYAGDSVKSGKRILLIVWDEDQLQWKAKECGYLTPLCQWAISEQFELIKEQEDEDKT